MPSTNRCAALGLPLGTGAATRSGMDIERAEALWRLGQLPVGDLQQVALDALAAGYYGPALVELAQFQYATRRDLGDLFQRALSEMDRLPISERQAGLRIAKSIAVKVLAGQIDPYEGAREIWQGVWEQAGRPAELTPFVGLASEYEDDFAHRQQYINDLIQEASNLINRQDLEDFDL